METISGKDRGKGVSKMKPEFYKILTWLCSLLGSIGIKIQSWAEYKEWCYWNDEHVKILNIPNDIKVFLYYTRKGDSLKVRIYHTPLVNGRYKWNEPALLVTEYTKEGINELYNIGA